MSRPDTLFHRMFEENRDKIWGHIFKKMPGREDAEDVNQKCWVDFATALKKNRPKKPEALLRTIAERRIADFYRKREKEPPAVEIDESFLEHYRHGSATTNLLAWAGRQGLSELEAAILERKFILGQTYPEMAPELGKTVKALQNAYSRIIKKLKERYHKGGKS
ncbi:MAG: sigma-70 family RNA polymerase sigma factor [Acidobacteriota bacterium]|nr:sigma-70 family RNA polymerase sigma factor [Acidobacteriota bacterium]